MWKCLEGREDEEIDHGDPQNARETVPCIIYPVSELELQEIDASSDHRAFTLTCCGDKAVFYVDTEADDVALFIAAVDQAKVASPAQVTQVKQTVDRIQSLFEGTFDKESADHVKLLERLWEASNLGVSDVDGSPVPFQVQSNRWKELGFQRDDPVSDLRATGLLGLQNLVVFAETYPSIFLHMARDQQQSSEMEYPFATAGINITFLMIQLLGLRKPQPWFPTMDTHPICFSNPRAWDELYTIVFRLFDQKWNQMLVGYMGFQKVIDSTREDVAGQLRTRNPMGDEPFIFEMLGILLSDLENFKTDTQRKADRAIHQFNSASLSAVPTPAPILTPPPTRLRETRRRPTKRIGSGPIALNRKSFAELPTPLCTTNRKAFSRTHTD